MLIRVVDWMCSMVFLWAGKQQIIFFISYTFGLHSGTLEHPICWVDSTWNSQIHGGRISSHSKHRHGRGFGHLLLRERIPTQNYRLGWAIFFSLSIGRLLYSILCVLLYPGSSFSSLYLRKHMCPNAYSCMHIHTSTHSSTCAYKHTHVIASSHSYGACL